MFAQQGVVPISHDIANPDVPGFPRANDIIDPLNTGYDQLFFWAVSGNMYLWQKAADGTVSRVVVGANALANQVSCGFVAQP